MTVYLVQNIENKLTYFETNGVMLINREARELTKEGVDL